MIQMIFLGNECFSRFKHLARGKKLWPIANRQSQSVCLGSNGIKVAVFVFCISEFNDSGSGSCMVLILILFKYQNRKRV